jgi:DeoR/GlpR family transcriptional regulator of sugar metabolism
MNFIEKLLKNMGVSTEGFRREMEKLDELGLWKIYR